MQKEAPGLLVSIAGSGLLGAVQFLNLLVGGSALFLIKSLVVLGACIATIVLIKQRSSLALWTALLAVAGWMGWLFWISYLNAKMFEVPISATLSIELFVIVIGLLFLLPIWLATRRNLLR